MPGWELDMEDLTKKPLDRHGQSSGHEDRHPPPAILDPQHPCSEKGTGKNESHLGHQHWIDQ